MSSRLDLLIHGGMVVIPWCICRRDLGIADGRFVIVEENIGEPAAEVIDATGLHIFPGILDAHVHFNEPGRTEWEGLASGSAALAAGGGTWFSDMPLNSSPPVIDAAAFNEKRRLAELKSVTDFSLWGGLVPGNIDKLSELHDAGAIGVKAFMCDSGLDEFPSVDAATLKAGIRQAARLGMMVAVHAEDGKLAGQLAAEHYARGNDAHAWLASRPVELELRAIRMATQFAGEHGAALHIVHVSSPEGLALIAEAKRRGVDVSAETCPHYLLLNEEDVLCQGAPAKCAPPLRPRQVQEGLWTALESGALDTIGSDHSPAPPELKISSCFFAVWGGISGCQHGFPLLLSEALTRKPDSLPRFAELLASNVGPRFHLPNKGLITPGFDADFSLLNFQADHTLHNSDLLYRHRQGPYDGRQCNVRVVQTFVRGKRIWNEGRIAPDAPRGRFIAPSS